MVGGGGKEGGGGGEIGPSESLVQTFRLAPVSSLLVKVGLGSNKQSKVGMRL